MVKFTFRIDNPSQHFVQISAVFPVTSDQMEVRLPSWRPGRYEVANFAKNVKHFKVFDNDRKKRSFQKSTKDSWQIDTSGAKEITVEYWYFANELNAGSTYLSDEQLYVNPVNCCVYTNELFGEKVFIDLQIPATWKVAGSLTKEESGFSVQDFEELMDTPFVASGRLQHGSYMSHGITFHVWFNGEVKPDWERVINDYQAFTDVQIARFSEFPVSEYHFINQILPNKAYHGVEHLKSTVIALGPSYAIFDALYSELLGVSSHELYHTWNVKAIRPIEMYPYDFSKENYSELGYIYEGITTYQGDLFLLKSGVFDEVSYFKEFNAQLQKHFDNHARFNYSVAASSFDTWLDGYTAGVPGRKVSIYTEGCILAFVKDVMIRRATGNKYGLDEVMKRLYFNFALQNKGVSERDYQQTLERVSGLSFDDFFSAYVHGCQPFESIVTDALAYLGLELDHSPSANYGERKLGIKTTTNAGITSILSIYPGSPAETAGLSIGDHIVAVNDYAVNGDFDNWLTYFGDDSKKLTVNRNGVLRTMLLPEVNRHFYMKYSVRHLESPNHSQKAAFEAWKRG